MLFNLTSAIVSDNASVDPYWRSLLSSFWYIFFNVLQRPVHNWLGHRPRLVHQRCGWRSQKVKIFINQIKSRCFQRKQGIFWKEVVVLFRKLFLCRRINFLTLELINDFGRRSSITTVTEWHSSRSHREISPFSIDGYKLIASRGCFRNNA